MSEYQSMLRKCCGWILFVLLFAAVFGNGTVAPFGTLICASIILVVVWAVLAMAGRKVKA